MAEWIELVGECEIITVQHDWAKAFEKAGDFDGAHFRMPYPSCCFGFKLSGRNVLAFVVETGERADTDLMMNVSIQIGETWFFCDTTMRLSGGQWFAEAGPFVGKQSFDKVNLICGDQIKAICVALSAEIAVTDRRQSQTRMFHNGQPTKQVFRCDYHVIDLSSRHRYRGEGGRIGTGKIRLHFRKGHWRRYASHQTYIEWMLVGNPDLGFIDKEYRI